MKVRIHIHVSGRVQGVFYRSNTQRKAEELGLNGWVRNLPDGRVEVVAEGEEELLEKLIDWCRIGPPAAKVERVEIKRESANGEFKTFAVKM
jgi:acylphosphatase